MFSLELTEQREKVEQECIKLQALVDEKWRIPHSCGVLMQTTSTSLTTSSESGSSPSFVPFNSLAPGSENNVIVEVVPGSENRPEEVVSHKHLNM
jgi:hypothetical protein